jgi:hypothetical protein
MEDISNNNNDNGDDEYQSIYFVRHAHNKQDMKVGYDEISNTDETE